MAYAEIYPDRIKDGKLSLIIDGRKAKIKKHKAELIKENENKKRLAKEAAARQAYERSDEYLWLKNGDVKIVPKQILGPKKNQHGWFDKWIKPVPDDWFEVCFKGMDNEDNTQPFWRVLIRGGQGWEVITYWSNPPSSSQEVNIYKAFEILEQQWNLFRIGNTEFQIEIPVKFILNNDQITPPEKYWNTVEYEDISTLEIISFDKNIGLRELAKKSLRALSNDRREIFLNAFFNNPK